MTDPHVIRTIGSTRHPILRTGTSGDPVDGACFELNDGELEATDAFTSQDLRRADERGETAGRP